MSDEPTSEHFEALGRVLRRGGGQTDAARERFVEALERLRDDPRERQRVVALAAAVVADSEVDTDQAVAVLGAPAPAVPPRRGIEPSSVGWAVGGFDVRAGSSQVAGEPALPAALAWEEAGPPVLAMTSNCEPEEAAGKGLRDQTGAQPVSALGEYGRVITVFSSKGGCGKTTLATNLAAVLADRGRREVCLVDLDLAFGEVAVALQLFPAHTIADAVTLGDNVDFGALQTLLTPHSPGLMTLVAPREPGSAGSVPASLVAHILEVLRERFDYVVVDTPSALDDQVLAAFDISDVVALIAILDVPALKNLELTLKTLELLNFPREKWRIVLNRADSKVGLSIADVEKTLRSQIAVQIPSSRDVPVASNRGVPIVLDDPRHPVSSAIRSFAERQIAAPGNVDGIPPSRAASVAAEAAEVDPNPRTHMC
jgi:MinD-like ATPase involved in chromosome partitioning or flagellar assembly